MTPLMETVPKPAASLPNPAPAAAPDVPETVIQQLVYPHGARYAPLFLADHPANRQQQAEFGVDHLYVTLTGA